MKDEALLLPMLPRVIEDLERIHHITIPPTLFARASIYTTQQFRNAFERTWGFSTQASGVLLPADDWSAVQQLLPLPKHLAAQEYLPWKCISAPHGFVLIKQRTDYPLWNLSHELIHFAQFEHSPGFHALVEQFEKAPSAALAPRRIEAELLYEICAFRDNVSLGVPGKNWGWAGNYLIEHYLPEELKTRGAQCKQDLSALREPLAAAIRTIIAAVQRAEGRLTPAQLTRIFFALPYARPFEELLQKLSEV